MNVSPATLRLAEQAWIAGRASLLGAHLIPGLVWARLSEDCMPRGAVVLELWGPDRVEAWALLERARPADTLVVLRVLPSNGYRRMLRWVAERWWRWVLRRGRLRARARV